MRKTRTAQTSIFDHYSEHEFGQQLKALADILDQHPELLALVEKDLISSTTQPVGRCGMTVENVFRCLVLKQLLQVSYDKLAFHLSDSVTYRTFVRLPAQMAPKKSSLQATIRRIQPATLETIHYFLTKAWLAEGALSLDQLRIDSTVVASNITQPSDSQLLNDGIRTLSRLLAKSRDRIGEKLRFTDQRPTSKSLAFRIFNSKNAEKQQLYPDLLKCAGIVLKQVERGLKKAKDIYTPNESVQCWITEVEHYRDLTIGIVDQTRRRVIDSEKVPSGEKIVSLFEPHTDVIVKGFRNVQYGHKINLSTQGQGFITYLSVEDGNPADKILFKPVLERHATEFAQLPKASVCDGGYASQTNVTEGRSLGVKQVVFNKRVGLSYSKMGVKHKTFKRLSDFRAGVEGNISELKRVFGATRALWKGREGFDAFVWSSVISYNLMRLARIRSG